MAVAYDSLFTRVDVFESPADATAVWRCTVWWMKTAAVPRVPIDANKSRRCENPSLGGPQTSVDKRMLLHGGRYVDYSQDSCPSDLHNKSFVEVEVDMHLLLSLCHTRENSYHALDIPNHILTHVQVTTEPERRYPVPNGCAAGQEVRQGTPIATT